MELRRVGGLPATAIYHWPGDRYRATVAGPYPHGMTWCCDDGHDKPVGAASCGVEVTRQLLALSVTAWVESDA